MTVWVLYGHIGNERMLVVEVFETEAGAKRRRNDFKFEPVYVLEVEVKP